MGDQNRETGSQDSEIGCEVWEVVGQDINNEYSKKIYFLNPVLFDRSATRKARNRSSVSWGALFP